MGIRLEGTLALSQRAKAARFRLRSSSLQSETMPAQPSYDLLHSIPMLVFPYHGKKDASHRKQTVLGQSKKLVK
ncbi:MAG: hypothetical protein ACETWK_12165 [Candidatus Aminicenantaceae bacterium]